MKFSNRRNRLNDSYRIIFLLLCTFFTYLDVPKFHYTRLKTERLNCISKCNFREIILIKQIFEVFFCKKCFFFIIIHLLAELI